MEEEKGSKLTQSEQPIQRGFYNMEAEVAGHLVALWSPESMAMAREIVARQAARRTSKRLGNRALKNVLAKLWGRYICSQDRNERSALMASYLEFQKYVR
jgi:hypothetical protein